MWMVVWTINFYTRLTLWRGRLLVLVNQPQDQVCLEAVTVVVTWPSPIYVDTQPYHAQPYTWTPNPHPAHPHIIHSTPGPQCSCPLLVRSWLRASIAWGSSSRWSWRWWWWWRWLQLWWRSSSPRLVLNDYDHHDHLVSLVCPRVASALKVASIWRTNPRATLPHFAQQSSLFVCLSLIAWWASKTKTNQLCIISCSFNNIPYRI